MAHTDIPEAPWYISGKRHQAPRQVEHDGAPAVDDPVPRRTCEGNQLPKRPQSTGYERPPKELNTYVPDHVAKLLA